MTTSFEIKCDVCEKLFMVTDEEFEVICNSFGAPCSDECREKLKQIMDKRKYQDVG